MDMFSIIRIYFIGWSNRLSICKLNININYYFFFIIIIHFLLIIFFLHIYYWFVFSLLFLYKAFNIKKETWKEFDLIPIPIINKAISLINQYKLYIEVLVNDLFLYLFIIGFSVSVGKLFY